MKFILKILFTLFLLSSCLDDYEERVRVETVPGFNVIRLQSVFTVILKNGSEYSISIAGDDDVISEIELKSTGDTLTFINHAKRKWTNPDGNKVTVEVTAPSFKTFISEQSYALYSAGELVIDEFYIWNGQEVKVSEIDLDVEGNYLFYWNNWLAGGKLTVTGSVESAQMYNYALHVIEAGDLHSNHTIIYNFGRENCEVNAKNRLQYGINGPGNIIVYGHPSEIIMLERTSTGQLITGH
jgi:hypothetical protein